MNEGSEFIPHDILCGFCDAPVSERTEPDGSLQLGCASCDNRADQDEVVKMAMNYVQDEAQLMLNRLARDAALQSKFMTFPGQTEHDKTHRFVVELKL